MTRDQPDGATDNEGQNEGQFENRLSQQGQQRSNGMHEGSTSFSGNDQGWANDQRIHGNHARYEFTNLIVGSYFT